MKQRNYGIDLLRDFAMFLVVMDHVVIANIVGGPNGAFVHNSYVTPQNMVLWLIFIVSLWCNILFGMITGYVMYHSKPKMRRVVQIWLEVFFYSVVIFAALYALKASYHTRAGILAALMPVTRGKYWYITSYFGLLVFVPFLNIIVNHIDRATALTVLTVFFVVVVTLPVFLFNHGDPYNLLKGKDMFEVP